MKEDVGGRLEKTVLTLLKGDVDDVQIWKRSLNAIEIAKIAYGSEIDRTELLLHVPLDEQRGIMVSDVGPYHHTGVIDGKFAFVCCSLWLGVCWLFVCWLIVGY